MLTSLWFKNIAIPILTVLITFYIKVTSKSRHATQKILTKEDFLVGIDLSVTGLIIFITNMVDLVNSSVSNLYGRSNELMVDHLSGAEREELARFLFRQAGILHDKIILSWWVLFAILTGLSVSSYLLREFGRNRNGELDFVFGLLIPNVFGLTILFVAAIWIS